MVLQSTNWLALSYFTYFLAYGVFLPFWGVWLKGEGLSPEAIGMLLGAGLAARFLGSLLIAPSVKDPGSLIAALRILGLLTLICCAGFWFGSTFAWVLAVIVGFNLFFGPLVPLTDALAGTWQRQISLDYGKVRVWGSLAFVVGSALTGELVDSWGHRVILICLLFSTLAMLLGMLLRPSVMPQGEVRRSEAPSISWRQLLTAKPVWRFLAFLAGVTIAIGLAAAVIDLLVTVWNVMFLCKILHPGGTECLGWPRVSLCKNNFFLYWF